MRLAGARRAARLAVRLLAGCLIAAGAQAGTPCAEGLWATAMLGSYHINPDRHFEDFNPGIGVECNFRPEWAAAAGYFRNSLLRPSFYGGAIYAPESLRWGAVRLAAMGGVISGYNYGRFGVGEGHRTGLILIPSVILEHGRFGANLFIVPPIPEDHLPLTLGFQARFRLR